MLAESTDRRAPQPSVTARGAETSRLEALVVLVVDDEPMVRRTIAELLARQGGYAVREAGTYRDAEAMLAAVDAVATDGHYPYHAGEATGPWGLTLARLARGHGKRAVLVSADHALIEQAEWEGIPALKKPGGILGLVAALAKAGTPHAWDPTVR
jgi:CheY-like chemotaxis protein